MLTRPGEIVGREGELGRFDAALAGVRAGGTHVLLVTGEPGIGKTALLDALAERAAAAGVAVLRARAAEQERDVPFALAVEALDDAVADLHPSRQAALDPELGSVLPALATTAGAEPPASPAQRFRLHRGLRGVVEDLATTAPLALVLDDLHWADPASLEWILHALRRPARRPHLIALAVRDVEPLPQLLDALRGVPGAEHVPVAPLADEAALALLADVPGARRPRLIAEAGGNPLYLQGLARTGGAELPATVMAAVMLEVADLDPAARTLVEGAAVAGDPFEADLAAVAAGADVGPELDALVARGLVAPGDGARLRFRHPLVRRAVYDGAPAGWRIGAHGRLAAELAARGVDAVGRAHHVEQAASVGDREATATLIEAAHQSTARAPATAARWYAAALRLDPGLPPDERAGLMIGLALALAADGRPGEARDVLVEVLAGTPADAVDMRLELTAVLASVEHALGRHAEAAERIDHALDGLADPPATLRARLDYERTVGAVYAQDLETLDTLAGHAADALRPTEPALAAADEGIAVIGALWNGRYERVEPLLERARASLRAVPEAAMHARPEAYFQTGYMEYAAENLPEALALLSAGLTAIRDGGQDRMLAPLATMHALTCFLGGDLAAGVESAELAEETARLQGIDYGVYWTLWVRALIADLNGERDLAERLADECLAASDRFGDLLVTRAGRSSIATLFVESDPERAARMIEDAAGPGFERVDVAGSGYLILAYIRALFATGRAAEADTAAGLLEDIAAASRLPLARIRARTARAEVLLRTGEAERAVAVAREAVALADARPLAARDGTYAAIALGMALGRAGEREAAISALRDAARRASGGAMWQLRTTAGQELRRLGARLRTAAPDATTADAHGLTDRERQVAEHVSAGRTNKEVAALLFLSPKTIEHTLTRVYAKVGVRSRTGLAAALRP